MKLYLSKTGVLLAVLLVMGAVAAPVMAGEVTKQLSVPYYEQEASCYCGPAVAQMWIDFHNGYISQDTLWSSIQSHNREGWPLWYTDPDGLAACVSDYLSNFVAEDRRWSYFDSANIAMAMDIVDLDNPTPALINDGDHWVLVKGVSYEDYYGSIYNIYGFWVHDPWEYDINHSYPIDDWSDVFTPVDIYGDESYWEGYWTHLRGYWGTDAVSPAPQSTALVSGEPVPGSSNVTRPAVWSDTLVRPTPTAGVDRETYYDQMTAYYEAVAKNVTLMADEEDDIPLTEDTDLAAFARQMMIKMFGYKEELDGAIPGEPVFVHSLDENRHDYYLIPFERDGYVTVVAQVSIKGDVADYSGAFTPAPKTQNVVRPTLEGARAVLAENGYDSTLPARLVWKPCEQTQSSAVPIWEFTKGDGDTVYVGYVPWKKQVEFYEELTMKKIAG
ncbi:hypothetical protein [Methanoculleus sp. UBA416]|jgi:hypothetical protein|uniref:hypothetical protein n=1 Tax=Methanoculleus sp. UBA416 TaxID=1915510 RepID=UPI00319DAE6A